MTRLKTRDSRKKIEKEFLVYQEEKVFRLLICWWCVSVSGVSAFSNFLDANYL
jgi:hypothetical protein